MNTGDLLSELRVGILNDRSDRVSGSADYLWTDATLIRYINEAYRRFARLSLVIQDNSTPEVTQVTLVAGQTEYPLHESVLSVRSAKNDGDTGDLVRAGHDTLSGYYQTGAPFPDPASYGTLPPGKVLAYTTDEALNLDDGGSFSVVTLRVYPAPDATHAGANVLLRVVRMPLDDLSATQLSAVPEIPRDHHLEMLDWAAYLALRIVDDDAGSPARAREFAASFDAHVKLARNNVMRKLFAPVGWGFGRNCFRWDS